MSYVNEHLHWAWLVFFALIILVSFMGIAQVSLWPIPTKTVMMLDYYEQHEGVGTLKMDGSTGKYSVTKGEDYSTPMFKAEEVTDEGRLQSQYLIMVIVWCMPTYVIGMFILSRWMLERKGRSKGWAWLSSTIFPIAPLLLDNDRKEANRNGI
jgi:hypothetical protein